MTEDTAVIEYRDEDTGTVFRWHGGAYIDVGYVTEGSAVFVAGDVINVWHDEMSISYLEQEAIGWPRPFRHILEAFEDLCRDYLKREW
jgi:hypothetical protein